MIQFITHQLPSWQARKKIENGAATYSEDIIQSQQLHWEKFFHGDPRNIVISTCPLLSQVNQRDIKASRVDLAIQYLHTFPYENPITYIQKIVAGFTHHKRLKSTQWVFLSAYRSYVDQINSAGFKAFFVPMSINTAPLVEIATAAQTSPIHADRVIWFGNIYHDKSKLYTSLAGYVRQAGFQLDTISRGLFNRQTQLSQTDAWQRIAQYQYGIGVGRCALEMYALGLKVVIAGSKFGGIIADLHDFEVQTTTNFNSRLITYDRDPKAVFKKLPESFVPQIRSIAEINHTTAITTSI